MAAGDAATAPLPLKDRLEIALNQLRIARRLGDPDGELRWEQHLDWLLDKYCESQRGNVAADQ
jgi:hypothetical protein